MYAYSYICTMCTIHTSSGSSPTDQQNIQVERLIFWKEQKKIVVSVYSLIRLYQKKMATQKKKSE